MTDSLATLHALSGPAAQVLPQLPLAPLLARMDRIQRLGLKDRRLQGLDLDNAAEATSRLVALAREGITSPATTQAIADLARLLADMAARAEALVAREAEQVAIHTAVAARTASGEPYDLTDSLRLLAAAPVSALEDDGRPGILVPLEGHCPKGAFGRITGPLYTLKADTHKRRTAAPKDALVLPAGALVRLEPGQGLILHTHGAEGLPRFQAPHRTDDIHDIYVEAKEDGATLYGPAVFSPHQDPFLLHDLKTHKPHLAEIANVSYPIFMKKLQFASALTALMTIPFMLITFIPHDDPTGIEKLRLSILGLTTGFTATALGATWRGRRLHQRACAEMRRLRGALPGPLANGSLATRATRLMGALRMSKQGFDTNPQNVTLPDMEALAPVPKIPLTSTASQEALNFHPTTLIEALHEQDVRVMEPLLALPAPTPVEDTAAPQGPRLAVVR